MLMSNFLPTNEQDQKKNLKHLKWYMWESGRYVRPSRVTASACKPKKYGVCLPAVVIYQTKSKTFLSMTKTQSK